MQYEYKPGCHSHVFNVLVVEDNEDHQALISISLQKSFPEANPIFMTSAQEALDYLGNGTISPPAFPRFVLLDIYLPQPELGWNLLDTLRRDHKRLPVIVFSAHYEPEAIRKAYDLGAHSFISKPNSGLEWTTYFETLADYWLRTVTLPPTYSL